ncbi:AAA family ATPase [Rhizobium leguminosarum bv. trifolii]|uniref:DNA 3'-5' helicase II n=1 Tax=Rhizobium leguminosarum bv. trifolii TaxID=386 RepID=A0A3E1BRD2_RHILT|nr:ATP-dependent helicase [Rhizobium leguminosarum]RFB96546.1 AAA family ATPase [Rhizobium leguminosarum bv. trifolii]RFB96669.1 AAA family ATPase [Rhizobium leguminosarum bv. trifolii]
MVDLTSGQRDVLDGLGHQLVTGGPGSGKTTVSILKAAAIARESLHPGQHILFLSFARATVSRVMEAIDEEKEIAQVEKSRIEVDTYHSFFWRILKTHGYLVGLPRILQVLPPPAEAVALSGVRGGFAKDSKLSDREKNAKASAEAAERLRLATEEGRVSFDLFAGLVGKLLHGSDKIRRLVSEMYPYIILDEFQDTSGPQWFVVKALGIHSKLMALADPEQRIFEFIGADPERLKHFKQEFKPEVHDLAADNHRSKGTEIALFGNDVLTGKFSQNSYRGIEFGVFESNQNQAYAKLTTTVLEARKRLIATERRDWSLAVLVPTRKMTRLVSDIFREPFGNLPSIAHSAIVDMEGPILAAETLAYLMQQPKTPNALSNLVDLICSYLHGRGGNSPTKTDIGNAQSLKSALANWNAALLAVKPPAAKSIVRATDSVLKQILELALDGNPNDDWIAVRKVLAKGDCARLNAIAKDVRNVRLLERGTQLRQGLIDDWRENGRYSNALEITRRAFVQDHFSTGQKPEAGIVVMNMHKSKGKQFDEVIIFEGWPVVVKGKMVANLDRIVPTNLIEAASSQHRQNFRVSVTRAKQRTTILTPRVDPCVLLLVGET